MIFTIVLGAAAFSAAGYLGVRLGDAVCVGMSPSTDGPKAGRPPIRLLVAGCGILGGTLVMQGDDATRLALSAILCVSLVACWTSDVRCGIVPDIFTLGPLGAVLLAAVLEQEWWHIVAAAVPFIPFAAAAIASKGRGMGWGDVKLAALGGAVLGIGPAMLAFSGACIAAVGVAWIRGRKTEPIAFAPYLATAIAVCLFFGLLP